MKQLKESLKKEQERSAAAWAATVDRSASIADVRGIFDEGHRIVQAKMRLKVRYQPRLVLIASIVFLRQSQWLGVLRRDASDACLLMEPLTSPVHIQIVPTMVRRRNWGKVGNHSGISEFGKVCVGKAGNRRQNKKLYGVQRTVFQIRGHELHSYG